VNTPFEISGAFHIVLRFLVLSMALIMVMTCHGQPAKNSAVKNRNDGYMLLGLVGYNYTDRYISEYSIDGAGGGDIIMSSATSGGSGVSCCVKLSRTYLGQIRVTVRWQVDGCVYLIKDDRTGAADKVRHFYYREVEVNVGRVPGQNPKYIESHFYPDGSVYVLLTEHSSKPLLDLNDKRPDKSYFPRCKDDKEPDD
jgi:hypothetical protein